jgi:hypothetical protein
MLFRAEFRGDQKSRESHRTHLELDSAVLSLNGDRP